MSPLTRQIRVVGSETAATRTVLEALASFDTEHVASVAGLAQRHDGAVVLVAPALQRSIESAVRTARRTHGAEPIVIAADEVPEIGADAVVSLNPDAIARRITDVIEESETQRARQRIRSLEALVATERLNADSGGESPGDRLCERLVESGLYGAVWVIETDGSSAVLVAASGVPTTALQPVEVDAETPWARAIQTGEAVVDNEGVPTIAVPFAGGCLVGTASVPIDQAEAAPLSELAGALDTTAGEARPRYALLGEAVSHEINNHLDLAMVHLELAEGEAEHVEHVEDALERIGSVTEEVEALVSRDVDISPCSLEAVATDVWEATKTREAKLRGDDVTIEADERLLRLLLSNLFRNAVEHGGEDVTVEVGPLDGGGFYVADDGEGFPADASEKLFEWGWSGGNSTGIGLALVGLAADQHGWDVESVDADGARFEFRP